MTNADMIVLWEAMQAAIAAQRWADLEVAATELELALREIADARSRSGPGRDDARHRHRDGLFAIGWQRVIHAPPSTQGAVRRYNQALHRVPGGIGRQPDQTS